MPCPCFAGEVRSAVGAKLGTCGRCVRTAAAGTVLAWGTAVVLGAVPRGGPLRLLARVVAGAFSVVLAAHVVAFGLRLGGRLGA